jgi:hypothetical protein
MKINPRIIFKIEALGLLLILLTIGWQVFVEDHVHELSHQNDIVQINMKLDDIWRYIGKIGSATTNDQTMGVTADFSTFNKSWTYAPGEDNFDEKAELYRKIRGLSYLIGTLMLSLGRYQELRMKYLKRDNKKSKEQK